MIAAKKTNSSKVGRRCSADRVIQSGRVGTVGKELFEPEGVGVGGRVAVTVPAYLLAAAAGAYAGSDERIAPAVGL